MDTSRFMRRKARRRAIWSITRTLEQILYKEEDYLFSIPDTVANEERYYVSEYFVGTLYDVIDSLRYID